MKRIRQTIVLIALFSIFALPATLPVKAAATINHGIYPETGRFYLFQNVHSGKFLEVADGTLVAETTVWQDTFEYDTNRAQVFRLLSAKAEDMVDGPGDSKYYQIKPSKENTLRLDVDNANDLDGTNIKVFGYNPQYGAQSFRLIKNNDDNSFRIEPYLSRNSQRVLSVVNGSSSNKANVVISTWTGDNSQRWVLKEFYLDQDPQLINLNWEYFFRGDYSLPNRRISQRVMMTASDPDDRHCGIDLPTDAGVPIYSPCAGEIIELGRVGDNIAESMGNYVIIRTTDKITVNSTERNLTIRLLHMKDPPNVSLNQIVTKNTLLGYVGNTGDSDGNHLHADINIKGYTGGGNIRSHPQHVINPEKLFLSKRFKYGLLSTTKKLATDYVFYPNWSQV